ncbi:MAG: hypothetical protein EXS31_05550 [Pedosphaera sp.]|nr:hypothetical protein [Pedosphaera sp.]
MAGGSLEPVLRTNTVVRRTSFTWDEIESGDFKDYIANLRRIGCPEETVRDIIVAEVNAMFERRRGEEIITPEQQWWRIVPDPAVAEAEAEQLDALEGERRSMLTELLGPNWDTSKASQFADFNAYLDGPILGKLPPETKEAIRLAEARATQARAAYLARRSAEGKEPEPAELDRLQRETLQELTKILKPEPLEEYRLRYSDLAKSLRNETFGLGLGPEDFRKIFRARDALDEEVRQHYAGADARSAQARQELDRKRDDAIKEAIGEDRYRLYRISQDPLFRQAQAVAEEVGAQPETVLRLYELNHAADQERLRLRNDARMTTEQRTAAVERMALERENALRKILGDDAYELHHSTDHTTATR